MKNLKNVNIYHGGEAEKRICKPLLLEIEIAGNGMACKFQKQSYKFMCVLNICISCLQISNGEGAAKRTSNIIVHFMRSKVCEARLISKIMK